MGEEGFWERSAFAHGGDDGEGFEARDEFIFNGFRGGGVVEGQEGVIEDCDFEAGFEGFEMRCGDILVVVENGEFDWIGRNRRHFEVSFLDECGVLYESGEPRLGGLTRDVWEKGSASSLDRRLSSAIENKL